MVKELSIQSVGRAVDLATFRSLLSDFISRLQLSFMLCFFWTLNMQSVTKVRIFWINV